MAESLDEGAMPKSMPVSVHNEASKFRSCERVRGDSDKTSAEEELQSLEYEEDCFYTLSGVNPTPSFDEVSDSEEADSENTYWTMDAETYPDLHMSDDGSDEDGVVSSSAGRANRVRVLILRSGDVVRRVRIGLQDWSQRKRNYRQYLSDIRRKLAELKLKKGEEPPLMISPDELNLQGLTEEEKEKQREIWEQELAKVEEEIDTLKSVLKSKIRQSQQLKKNLGFTMWREISGDLSQGVKTVKETSIYQSVEGGLSSLGKAVAESPVYHTVEEKVSNVGKAVSENPVYQRTESVVKMTAESTRSIIGGLTGGFTQKLGQLKNSESFRSLEDKVGSAYENVKTKVSTSRSNSMQSFDDALREETERRAATVVTSPTIPEGKPFP